MNAKHMDGRHMYTHTQTQNENWSTLKRLNRDNCPNQISASSCRDHLLDTKKIGSITSTRSIKLGYNFNQSYSLAACMCKNIWNDRQLHLMEDCGN